MRNFSNDDILEKINKNISPSSILKFSNNTFEVADFLLSKKLINPQQFWALIIAEKIHYDNIDKHLKEYFLPIALNALNELSIKHDLSLNVNKLKKYIDFLKEKMTVKFAVKTQHPIKKETFWIAMVSLAFKENNDFMLDKILTFFKIEKEPLFYNFTNNIGRNTDIDKFIPVLEKHGYNMLDIPNDKTDLCIINLLKYDTFLLFLQAVPCSYFKNNSFNIAVEKQKNTMGSAIYDIDDYDDFFQKYENLVENKKLMSHGDAILEKPKAML